MGHAGQTPACAHCGLPVEHAPAGHESGSAQPLFCCVGCEAVYHAIAGSGFERFYQLREASRAVGQPAAAPSDRGFSLLDTAAFRERHTRLTGGQTRPLYQTELVVDGVHCGGCAWLVEQLPSHVEGIHQARLDLARARLRLTFEPEARLAEVGHWLSRFGYHVVPVATDRGTRTSRGERRQLLRVGVSWALAANVMLFSIAFYAGLDTDPSSHDLYIAMSWLALVLATGSVMYGGQVFFRRAALAVAAVARQGIVGLSGLSMDVPIALGIAVGWAYSVWATIAGHEPWFDSIAVLIAALLSARWLQQRGRRLAGDAAERLISLLPATAHRERHGELEEVSTDLLEPGDVVVVRAGEAVPGDGQILQGRSSVSRAALTGESRPEPVEIGDRVEAGSTNLASVLRVRLASVGDQTRVGKLLAWVEERASHRAPIVQLADRIGAGFVALVLIAAAATFAIWVGIADASVAVRHTVALLVISCPCALGMATPLALTVAMGRAARHGVFVKHDDVLDRCPDITTVVFDKTGTLTSGRMSVVDALGDRRALVLATALERHSAHPVARAIVEWSDGRPSEASITVPTNVVETVGVGVSGRIDGQPVIVRKLTAAELQSPGTLFRRAAAASEAGQTPVAVAIDGTVLGLFVIGDELRHDATDLICALRDSGRRTILLSGDHPAAVVRIADELMISRQDAHGGITPEGKLAHIESLVSSGEVVAMIGDGVNDAAAIQAADLGIAVGGGTEASVVAADIFVTRHGLAPVLDAIVAATGARRVIRRTLALSAAYNAIAIALAALGLVSPLVAAVAMPISSLAVVLSALYQPTKPLPRAPRQLRHSATQPVHDLREMPRTAHQPG